MTGSVVPSPLITLSVINSDDIMLNSMAATTFRSRSASEVDVRREFSVADNRLNERVAEGTGGWGRVEEVQ